MPYKPVRGRFSTRVAAIASASVVQDMTDRVRVRAVVMGRRSRSPSPYRLDGLFNLAIPTVQLDVCTLKRMIKSTCSKSYI